MLIDVACFVFRWVIHGHPVIPKLFRSVFCGVPDAGPVKKLVFVAAVEVAMSRLRPPWLYPYVGIHHQHRQPRGSS